MPSNGDYYIHSYSDLTNTAAAQPWWSLTFDLVIKLGLVIGLIYLTMWALRRFMSGARASRSAPGRLSVLDTTLLAPNRAVYLVEVADRVLVLGSTANALNTLAEITEPNAIEVLKRATPPPEALPNFAEQLRALTDHLPEPLRVQPSIFHDKLGELRALAGRFRQ